MGVGTPKKKKKSCLGYISIFLHLFLPVFPRGSSCTVLFDHQNIMAYWARQPARSSSSSSTAVGKYSSWTPSFTSLFKSPFPPIAQTQGTFAQRPISQSIFRPRIHISTECRDLIESVIFTKAITERSFGDMQRVNLGTYLKLVKDNIYLFKDICGVSRGELVVLEILKLHTNDAHNQLITAQKLIDDLEKRTLLNIPPRREDALAELASYKERVQSAYYGLEVGDSGRTTITHSTALLSSAPPRGIAATAPSSMSIDMVTNSLPMGMEVHGLRSSDSWSQVMLNLQTEHSRLRSTDVAMSVLSMGTASATASASASASDAVMVDTSVSDRIDAMMALPRLPAPVLFADDEEVVDILPFLLYNDANHILLNRLSLMCTHISFFIPMYSPYDRMRWTSKLL